MPTRTLFVLVAVVASLGAQGTITSISPASTLALGPAFTLTVHGSGFGSLNLVQWDGSDLPTTFVSAATLTASVGPALITSAGTHGVRVKQSLLQSNFSNTVTFTVNNPVPTLGSISPTSTLVGSGPVTVDFFGTGYLAASVARLGGTNLPTTVLTNTHIQATVSASLTATAGTLVPSVVNPAPGGGTASGGSFVVTNPIPTLGSISPTSATAGIAGLTLTANGTNYNSSTVVRFDGAALTTALVSATQVTAQLPTAQVATGAVHTITVNNPSPGGGTSASRTLTVNNPVPTISGVSPGAAVAGATTTLTITGSGFNSATLVEADGSSLPTTFSGNALQVTATLSPILSAAGTTSAISVFNPLPGGGASAGALSVTISNPVPVSDVDQSDGDRGDHGRPAHQRDRQRLHAHQRGQDGRRPTPDCLQRHDAALGHHSVRGPVRRRDPCDHGDHAGARRRHDVRPDPHGEQPGPDAELDESGGGIRGKPELHVDGHRNELQLLDRDPP